MYVPRSWDLKEQHGALFTRDKAVQKARFFFLFPCSCSILTLCERSSKGEHNEP